MAKKKKSWQEKLADSKDLPKVCPIEGRLSKRWGEGTVVIPAPKDSFMSAEAAEPAGQARRRLSEFIFVLEPV